MKMMYKALERSWLFARGWCRFSFRDSIKHPSKATHRKFKFKKSNHIEKERNLKHIILYWGTLVMVPLILLLISFSFISEPSKFFSKSGGMNMADMEKFIIIPGVALILFIVWAGYSYIKSPHKVELHKKTKIKHIKVEDKICNEE